MKILFKVFPQKSHLNATFPFARALQAAGHHVVYTGIAQLRGHVETQGLDYHIEANDVFEYQEPSRNSPRLSVWTILKNWRQIQTASKLLHRRSLARPDVFEGLITSLRPDIILVDSPYTLHALALRRHRVPFAMLESMMRLDQDIGCPPLDTDFVPRPGMWCRIICSFHWRRYRIKKALLSRIGIRADLQPKIVRDLAKRIRVHHSRVDYDRYFHLGVRDCPELILSPQALDFPRKLRPNQYYVGASVDLARQEVASDYRFPAIFEDLSAARTRGTPLVYCSLGTANWRYVGAERFLQRVGEATRGQPWNLILVIGNEFSLEAFHPLPSNVHVFQSVPQLQVLRHCDLMITHGGMNSISECVILGVPMLVYPGTNEIDQAGNAARVVFHGAGIKGKLASESTGQLVKKINCVLSGKTYLKKVAELREQLIAASIDVEKANRLIESVRDHGMPRHQRAVVVTSA